MVCNRSRASSTRTRTTSTDIGWRVIHWPRSVRIERNCALGLSTQVLRHSFSQYGPPSRQITYMYSNSYEFVYLTHLWFIIYYIYGWLLLHLWLSLHLWLIITLMGDAFVVNYNICGFNPLSLSPYPLLQWRLGNPLLRVPYF